jgi:hypothetical protein
MIRRFFITLYRLRVASKRAIRGTAYRKCQFAKTAYRLETAHLQNYAKVTWRAGPQLGSSQCKVY